jgi:membrane protease YdiL (CAAX protease family)
MEYGINKNHHKMGLAIGAVLVLFAAYITVYTLPLNDALSAILELIPGLLGIIILIRVFQFSLEECYLHWKPISRQGLVLLLGFFVILIPILVTGRWTGWNWTAGIIYAPASGIAQELFFRVTLLPVIIRLFKSHRLLAVIVHSVLFSIWHAPLAFTTAPLGGAIAVVIVTFIGGMLWGWQVQRDRTAYWATFQHIIYLMLVSLFIWE